MLSWTIQGLFYFKSESAGEISSQVCIVPSDLQSHVGDLISLPTHPQHPDRCNHFNFSTERLFCLVTLLYQPQPQTGPLEVRDQVLWVSSGHLKATTGGISCLSLWLCGIRAPIRNSFSAWKPTFCHKDTAKGKECPFGCLELCLYGSKTSDLILDLEWTFLSSSPDPSSLTVSQNDINFSHCYEQQG